MIKVLISFLRNRRGAFALITAAAALPLVMLTGLAIDYSFYAQARAQFSLAGDAAATYAIREATATYTLTQNIDTAQSVGQTSGAQWFNSQLATLPTASVSGGTPNVTVTPNTNLSPTNPAGFTATVAYTGVYPPFFGQVFNNKANWYITGTSSATSQYSYVELLVLMDTSSSMLVSADTSDVQKMDDNTVCIPNSFGITSSTIAANRLGVYVDTPTPFVNWASVENLAATNPYTLTSSSTSGTTATANCASNTNNFYTTTVTTGSGRHQTTTTVPSPLAPCAFACHQTTSTNSSGYYIDLYGLARSLGVKLKTDVVFSSLESMISSMQSSQQVLGQFTVGVYQFNDNACPIVKGGSGDALPEATSSLSTALTIIQGDDYQKNSTETAMPPLSDNSENRGHTDFPTSVLELISGKFYCGETTANETETLTAQPASYSWNGSNTFLATPPSSTSLLGTEPQYPQRDIFIVTDGMQDSASSNLQSSFTQTQCGRVEGEMAGINAEATGSTTSCDLAICSQLKALGFTIYVLQITYPSTQVQFYYNNGQTPPDKYTQTDFPSLTSSTDSSIQNWNEGMDIQGNNLASPPPTEQGLEACASAPQDYFQASSSTAIQTAMGQMLNSALSAAVRITN